MRKVRKPVVKLDNYPAYISQTTIRIPITGIGDPLLHDILHLLNEADYRLYFEESYYKVLEWEINTSHDDLLLKVEKENNNDRKI